MGRGDHSRRGRTADRRNGAVTVTGTLVQADLAGELAEAAVLLEEVEPWVDLDGGELEGAVVAGLGQPAESLVRLPEGEVDGRELEGGDVAALGQGPQLPQDPHGHLPLAGEGE